MHRAQCVRSVYTVFGVIISKARVPQAAHVDGCFEKQSLGMVHKPSGPIMHNPTLTLRDDKRASTV